MLGASTSVSSQNSIRVQWSNFNKLKLHFIFSISKIYLLQLYIYIVFLSLHGCLVGYVNNQASAWSPPLNADSFRMMSYGKCLHRHKATGSVLWKHLRVSHGQSDTAAKVKPWGSEVWIDAYYSSTRLSGKQIMYYGPCLPHLPKN